MVIRCLWFLLLTTSSMVPTIILPSCWRIAEHSTWYLKSSSLLWPSWKNASEFNNPVDILLSQLAVMRDQHVYYNCTIQNGRIHSGQVILVPISKHFGTTDFVPNLTALEERVHSHVWRVNADFHPWPERLYRAWRRSCSIFLKCIKFLGTIRFLLHLLNIVWQCYIINWICDINMPFNT